ncbi:MAG: hypothetical protein GWN73_14005, partial [Actinobacteria bacterium]|nr:hypothetical protein [Actinomycetota bacterium]NIT95617.1 hypothetical protein [Actinomycetota bacterium]NIU66465.1 hypothetical protein [Actinomycetota bacterium]NIW28277.1 hypothetical protein [Actinomycetota bacterium]NIX50602.1 hypothetical protein [Actinomycetota bacterium]
TDPSTFTVKELLYDTDGDLDADNCDSGGPDNGCLDNLISWMLGATGTNGDEPRRALAGHRWAWSDQLHSEPLVISFGGTEAAPVIKIFGGTNDGGFFMANESTGVEEWIAYPQATLGMQELLMGYTDATNRSYGMDAKPSGRLKDVDGDGIIEADDGDYVHVYIGMRRGGRNLYGFNVTPASPLTDPNAVGGIAPKMLWRIEGGVSAGYGRLGQTWATAIPTKIAVGTESKTVLVMAGGYDPGQDSGFGSADGMGNAIYIIDPEDGSMLWSVSSIGSGATLELAEMRYSIPGGATVADSNADGLGDTLYAVDVAGQVWRVDLAATLSDSTAARLAALSNDETTGTLATAPADQRKFFYAPTVARVIDPSYSTTGASEYNLVVFTSGDRANPLHTAVQDRAYAIRDYGANIRIELDGSNAPTNYPVCNPGAAGCDTPLDHGDLFDATDVLILSSDDTDDAVSADEPIDVLQASHGWYFDLETDGEKGWAPTAVLEDTI